MRAISLIFLTLAVSLAATEPNFPLWDGLESVADYAKRVNLPPTKTLDLGNGVKLELVLIPAGTFIMGTPEPTPVDEKGLQRKIYVGLMLLKASAIALFVMLSVVLMRAIQEKRSPQVSLALLLLMTIAAGGCVLSGLHVRYSDQALVRAKSEYAAAKARYDAANPEEKSAHAVTLTKPFYLGMYEVTQEQYQAVIGAHPSRFAGKTNPVESMSWDVAQSFCKKLSKQTNQAVRLPTEAEWEFSCRAGTMTTHHSGDTERDLDRVAWYSRTSNNTTHPVGQKEANTFGLFDMHGNAWEWCQDWHGDEYYSRSPYEDPQGAEAFEYRVLRGGSYLTNFKRCRSAARFSHSTEFRYYMGVGFRVAVPVSRTP